MSKYVTSNNLDRILNLIKNNVENKYANINHSHNNYLPTSNAVCSGSLIINDIFYNKRGLRKTNSGNTRGFLLNTYSNNGHTYLDMVITNNEATDYLWSNGLRFYDDGRVFANLKPSSSIKLENNVSLKGYTTANGLVDICGVDSNNNIYLGWSNQLNINVNNTTRFYKDVTVASNLTSDGIHLRDADWTAFYLGGKYVRFEYSKGDRCAYIAGSESEFNGYGTPFKAKHFESIETWNKFGNYWLTIDSNATPGGIGDVWIRI